MTTNSTAHEGIEKTSEPEYSVEEILQDDEVTSHQIMKAKNKILSALTEENIKNGMKPEDAQKSAEKLISEIVTKKRKEEKTIQGEFDYDFLKVYMHDSFLGSVSLEISKIADVEVPTAYIGVRPNGRTHEIIMGYNPKFFRSLSSKQRQGTIKHEMYHLIFQHIFDRAVGNKEYQLLWNWATDLAINSIIGGDNLPDCCLVPGKEHINPKTGKPTPGPYAEFIKNAPPMKSSDYYFKKLREIQENDSKNDNKSMEISINNGMGTLDDHNKWDEIPPEVQDAIRDKVHEMLEGAVKKAERNNDWGSVPFEIQQVIRRLISREVDWRSILRNFIGRCRTMERNSTIRRINKKLPYLLPGVKRKHVATFSCFIDQSGSMSNDDISMLFSELESFAQHTQLDVYHFDTQIDEKSHTVWKKGRATPKAHRTRCGGTNFQAVSDFCNRRDNRGKWSGIVILTDGYAPGMTQIIGSRVLWVITENGSMEAVTPGDLAIKMKESKTFKRY